MLQSDMCCVNIPELEFSTTMSGSAGKFTTLEGLLDDLISQVGFINGKNCSIIQPSNQNVTLPFCHASFRGHRCNN